MIEILAGGCGALFGIVVGLVWLLRAVRPKPLPASPLERLREEYAMGDAVDGMEPWEFEARAAAIMEGAAVQAEEWAPDDRKRDIDRVWGVSSDVQAQRDFRRRAHEEARVRFDPPAADASWLPLTPRQQEEVHLALLEEAYPELRDAQVARVVVDKARELAGDEWKDPAVLETIYLDWRRSNRPRRARS